MKVWAKAAVSVGLLGLLFALLPWNDVRAAFARMPVKIWFGVLGLFALGHLAGVQKWRLLLQASRGRIGSGAEELILEKLSEAAALATLADLATHNPLLAATSEADLPRRKPRGRWEQSRGGPSKTTTDFPPTTYKQT